MKKLLIGAAAIAFAASTWANCSTQTYQYQGKFVTCTTCCYYGNCNTTCY